MIDLKVNNEIKTICDKWRNAKYSEIEIFKYKEYERVFSAIYTFEFVVVKIDEIIDNNEKECSSQKIIEQNGHKYKLITENYKIENALMNKWRQLEEVGMTSVERKELNLTYEDYLKLKYARYKGFIDSVLLLADKL